VPTYGADVLLEPCNPDPDPDPDPDPGPFMMKISHSCARERSHKFLLFSPVCFWVTIEAHTGQTDGRTDGRTDEQDLQCGLLERLHINWSS